MDLCDHVDGTPPYRPGGWISVQDAGGKLLSSKYVIGPKLVDIDWFKAGRDGIFTFQADLLLTQQLTFNGQAPCALVLINRFFFCTNWACVELGQEPIIKFASTQVKDSHFDRDCCTDWANV